MFKRIRPVSLILLAGAFSFPKSAWWCCGISFVSESVLAIGSIKKRLAGVR